MSNTTLLNDEQLKALSILADKHGDDRFFAACAAAYKGDRSARVAVTRAYNARRAQLARR